MLSLFFYLRSRDITFPWSETWLTLSDTEGIIPAHLQNFDHNINITNPEVSILPNKLRKPWDVGKSILESAVTSWDISEERTTPNLVITDDQYTQTIYLVDNKAYIQQQDELTTRKVGITLNPKTKQLGVRTDYPSSRMRIDYYQDNHLVWTIYKPEDTRGLLPCNNLQLTHPTDVDLCTIAWGILGATANKSYDLVKAVLLELDQYDIPYPQRLPRDYQPVTNLLAINLYSHLFLGISLCAYLNARALTYGEYTAPPQVSLITKILYKLALLCVEPSNLPLEDSHKVETRSLMLVFLLQYLDRFYDEKIHAFTCQLYVGLMAESITDLEPLIHIYLITQEEEVRKQIQSQISTRTLTEYEFFWLCYTDIDRPPPPYNPIPTLELYSKATDLEPDLVSTTLALYTKEVVGLRFDPPHFVYDLIAYEYLQYYYMQSFLPVGKGWYSEEAVKAYEGRIGSYIHSLSLTFSQYYLIYKTLSSSISGSPTGMGLRYLQSFLSSIYPKLNEGLPRERELRQLVLWLMRREGSIDQLIDLLNSNLVILPSGEGEVEIQYDYRDTLILSIIKSYIPLGVRIKETDQMRMDKSESNLYRIEDI